MPGNGKTVNAGIVVGSNVLFGDFYAFLDDCRRQDQNADFSVFGGGEGALVLVKKVLLNLRIRILDLLDRRGWQNEIFQRAGIIVKTVHVAGHAFWYIEIARQRQNQLITYGADTLLGNIAIFIHVVVAQDLFELNAAELAVTAPKSRAFENFVTNRLIGYAKAKLFCMGRNSCVGDQAVEDLTIKAKGSGLLHW